MTNLLELVTRYLAAKTGLTAGTQAFYNEMPAEPAKCIVVQEEQNDIFVLPQIDAEVHKVRITARDSSYTLAQSLAELCWRWLLTDIDNFTIDKREDATGVLTMLDPTSTIIHVRLYGNPVFEKADQQGRKYYYFYALITTKR